MEATSLQHSQVGFSIFDLNKPTLDNDAGNNLLYTLMKVPLRRIPQNPFRLVNTASVSKITLLNLLPAQLVRPLPSKCEDPRQSLSKRMLTSTQPRYSAVFRVGVPVGSRTLSRLGAITPFASFHSRAFIPDDTSRSSSKAEEV